MLSMFPLVYEYMIQNKLIVYSANNTTGVNLWMETTRCKL